MRLLKDDKYQTILDVARSEFITRGYKDTSMRIIAKNANVGLSNIYNYFENKDDIFLAIVGPAKEQLFSFVLEKHTEKYVDIDFLSTLRFQEETIEEYIRLLVKYKDELRLLLYHSEGSSIRNFRDVLTEHLTAVSNKHMDLIKKHFPQINDISPFLMHTLCSFMVSIVGEIITHDLSMEEIRDFFREYFKFEIAGWRELIGL